MKDTEKLDLIRKLVVNISPIDFTNEQQAQGAAHAMCVAIELIVDLSERCSLGRAADDA